MSQPILRPSPIVSEPMEPAVRSHTDSSEGSAYPKRDRKIRPGWKATLIRSETFSRIRAIQKSTKDPAIDLSYLTDACLQIALDGGGSQIVQRALDSMRPASTTTP